MSTLKSSAEDPTLNADGSGNDIILQSNGSNIATIDQAGFRTATTFAGSGASLTALNATNLGSGTVPTARLGSGTASSSTFLRGDSTYAEAGGGKITQLINTVGGTSVVYNSTTGTAVSCDCQATITPTSSSHKILVMPHVNMTKSTGGADGGWIVAIRRNIDSGGETFIAYIYGGWMNASTYIQQPTTITFLDSPSTALSTNYNCVFYSQHAGTNANTNRHRSMTLMEVAP